MLLGTRAFIRRLFERIVIKCLLFVDLGLAFGILDRNGKGLGFGLGGVFSADKSGVSLDEDDQGKNARSDNGPSHELEGGLVLEVAESESEADGSGVSSGSDDSRDGSGGRGVNVRDNSVGGTFGGLDKEGEEDHDGDGGSKGVGLGEDQDKNTFGEEADGLGPKTSTHSVVVVTDIGQESSKSTGEEVHESEDGGNGGGGFGGEFELVLEVKGGGVVHGKFDTEAAGILDEKQPGVDVEGTLTEGGSGGDFGHLSVLLEFRVVTLGGIVGDHVDHDTGSETNNSRDKGDSTPGLGGVTAGEDLEKREKSRSHDELGDTSSKVTPSSAKSVGGSDDFLAEHSGRPVLAHDEGTSGGTNEKTKDPKTGGVVDKTGAGGRDGSTAKDGGHRNTGTPLIASRSEDETHEDGSSDSSNGGSPDLLLGKVKILLDLGQERSNGEPDEEGNEETPPRHVEGSHVGAGERTKLDGGGLVILVRIDIDPVLVVLLPLSGCSSVDFRHDDSFDKLK